MKLLNCLGWAGCLAVAMVSHSADCMAQTRLWGTYYGGESADDQSSKIAVDSSGNIYVIGTTGSATGIATPNGFDPIPDATRQTYIAKFDTNGFPIWATYYGDNYAAGYDLALDTFGNVYVVGEVACPSASLSTPNTHDASCSGGSDTFVAKFDTNGKRIWGTYYGGENLDVGVAISVSLSGNVYIAGSTNSPTGIASPGSPGASFNGFLDGFIAKFDALGKLSWGRYYGGEKYDVVKDIACKDATTAAPTQCFIVGSTQSVNGIATNGAFDTVLNGEDAFLAKVNSVNGNIEWGTYYGGSAAEGARSIAVDQALNLFVSGITYSTNGMTTPNAYDTSRSGAYDGFLARFTAGGSRQVGTYFGGDGEDVPMDLAVDAMGNLYAIGRVHAAGNLITPIAYDKVLNGSSDALFSKFDQALFPVRSSYYGGNQRELYGNQYTSGGIAIDKANHIYIFGNTDSTDAIATPGASKIAPQLTDMFIAEFLQ